MAPASTVSGVAKAPRRPDPPPLETDDVRAVSIGTAIWALALVGLLPLRARLVAAGRGWWLWVCAVGVLLGLAGVAYCVRRRRRRSLPAAEADQGAGVPTAGTGGGANAGEPR